MQLWAAPLSVCFQCSACDLAGQLCWSSSPARAALQLCSTRKQCKEAYDQTLAHFQSISETQRPLSYGSTLPMWCGRRLQPTRRWLQDPAWGNLGIEVRLGLLAGLRTGRGLPATGKRSSCYRKWTALCESCIIRQSGTTSPRFP